MMLLAAEAGLDKSYASGVERGEFNPSVKKVAKIANILGIRAYELLKPQ
jgi:transcriptional regulator with XRE-family HTH domain